MFGSRHQVGYPLLEDRVGLLGPGELWGVEPAAAEAPGVVFLGLLLGLRFWPQGFVGRKDRGHFFVGSCWADLDRA